MRRNHAHTNIEIGQLLGDRGGLLVRFFRPKSAVPHWSKRQKCAENVRQKSKNMWQMCDQSLIKCGICMGDFGLGDFVRHTNV